VIQVGEVLDKYELLERVGQGGMAVVYRGLDRSLKRVVAIKILHKHLSDYQEARDRFEREAQAVAKLRHENILEIFDYSGADAAKAAGSSYIVTEFIDGHTLKQVVTDRPIQFPEIGAMIVLQVCRALAHAHGAGILHRDVKPENIMVRSDGVVKLMDFGISHMLDLERLTVTGQLLGSPAYMAPEHVEGRQLDFRTDVFAAGIVLYQLTVGRLPFEGKNPHEVLKRIAECKFIDPRQANPQIGNRLGRLILRAMAADPNDRFPNVGEMVLALEGYLEESGIAADKVPGELSRYFEQPVAYEQAFETRLVDHLTTRGQKLLTTDERSAALDVFDRVLTIDPENEKVLAILDGINRRRRMRQAALAGLGVCVMAFCAYMVHRNSRPIDAELPDVQLDMTSRSTNWRDQLAMRDDLATPHPIDAMAIAELDARAGSATDPPAPDAPPVIVGTPTFVRVYPERGAEYQLGSESWRPVPEDGKLELALLQTADLQVRNTGCCQAEVKTLRPGDSVTITTAFLPAVIVPRCAANPEVSVTIDDKPAHLNQHFTIPIGASLDGTQTVKVRFLGEGIDPQPKAEKVKYKDSKEVTCAPR
jgi:serine/threonine-protein kinase